VDGPVLDSVVVSCGNVVGVDGNVCVSKDVKAVNNVVDLEVSGCSVQTLNIVRSSGQSNPSSSTLWWDL
jgi:hypothetical protein